MLIYDKLDIRYSLVALLCVVSCLFCSGNFCLALVTVVAQVMYLLLLVLKNRVIDAIVNFTIFLSLSLEFEYTAGNFYGLKTFRVFGISVAVWIIFLFFGLTIINYRRNGQYINQQAKIFSDSIIRITIIAIVVGTINIILNDNSVRTENGWLGEFVIQVYTILSLVLIPAMVITHYSAYEEFRIKAKKAIIIIMIALVSQQYISLILGITGEVTGQRVPLVSSVQLYGAFLLLFALTGEHNNKKILGILGILGYIISFMYSQGSGQYIMLFSVPIWLLLIMVGKKKYDRIILFFILGLILGPLALYVISNRGVAVQYKLDQAISFLNVFSDNWRELMPMSARFRVEELIDIFIEYKNKPLYILIGKGVMGTIRDYTSFFRMSEWAVGTSAYSKFEWSANVFFSVHESINKLFLSSGMIGVAFLVGIIYKAIKWVKYTPLFAIGCMWIIWYWGYSTTISWFGMICLILAFYEVPGSYEQVIDDERRIQNG